jgi:4-hydroxy-3-methylbut-2-en-1-yl diphosphate reductase
MIDVGELTVVAPTGLEARAARRAMPGVRIVRSGVSLSRLPHAGASLTGIVVTCGVAGSLRSGLPTGTVLVPRRVLRPDGRALECDAGLVAALAAAARRLGREPDESPMATTPTLVVGAERAAWAARGCAGADMETGLLAGGRVASIRVVLDTPERELHAAWGRPLTVLWHPGAWPQLPWLAAEAPRCARLAAEVLAEALVTGPGSRAAAR